MDIDPKIAEQTRQALQWHVLARLQKCRSVEAFEHESAELMKWGKRVYTRDTNMRQRLYYLAFLLEETQRDDKSGLVFFSDKVSV